MEYVPGAFNMYEIKTASDASLDHRVEYHHQAPVYLTAPNQPPTISNASSILHTRAVTFTVLDYTHSCQVTCLVTDDNFAVERAIAAAVRREPGTFGLVDMHGAVSMSAQLLESKQGPFYIVPIQNHNPNLQSDNSIEPSEVTYPAQYGYHGNHQYQHHLQHYPQHVVPSTSQSEPQSPTKSTDSDEDHVQLSPQMLCKLGLDPSTLASRLELPAPLQSSSIKEQSFTKKVTIPTSPLRHPAVPRTNTSSDPEVDEQLSLEQVRRLMTSVDEKLTTWGLTSQRAKCRFLSRIGYKISQQHYSTTLHSARQKSWLGGVRASSSIRKMASLVLNLSKEKEVAYATLAIEVQRSMRGGSNSSLEDLNTDDADLVSDSSRSSSRQSSPTRPYKPVRRIPEHLRLRMMSYFQTVSSHPPRSVKERFAQEGQLSIKQINVFFQNLRARRKKPPAAST